MPGPLTPPACADAGGSGSGSGSGSESGSGSSGSGSGPSPPVPPVPPPPPSVVVIINTQCVDGSLMVTRGRMSIVGDALVWSDVRITKQGCCACGSDTESGGSGGTGGGVPAGFCATLPEDLIATVEIDCETFTVDLLNSIFPDPGPGPSGPYEYGTTANDGSTGTPRHCDWCAIAFTCFGADDTMHVEMSCGADNAAADLVLVDFSADPFVAVFEGTLVCGNPDAEVEYCCYCNPQSSGPIRVTVTTPP